MSIFASTDEHLLEIEDCKFYLKKEMNAGDQEDFEDYVTSLHLKNGVIDRTNYHSSEIKLAEINLIRIIDSDGKELPKDLRKLKRHILKRIIQEIEALNRPLE